MNRARLTRFFICILAGVIAAMAIAYVQTRNATVDAATADNGFIGQPFGGDFAGLMDQDGKILERDAFHDKYELVFFGFTHCPAICPAELQKLTYVLKNLSPKAREKLAVIFVSVDPVRDTPDTLKNYISVFDQGITGVTGRQENIDRVLADWKVYAAKVPLEGGDYTMDHSAFLYLRGPTGVLEGTYPAEDTPEALLAALKVKLDG